MMCTQPFMPWEGPSHIGNDKFGVLLIPPLFPEASWGRGFIKWYYLGTGEGVLLDADEKMLVSFDRSSLRDATYSPRREDPVSYEQHSSTEGPYAMDLVYGHSWRSHGST
jgi:hypothetical protein